MKYLIIIGLAGVIIWLFYKIRGCEMMPDIEDTNPYPQTRKTNYDKLKKIKEVNDE